MRRTEEGISGGFVLQRSPTSELFFGGSRVEQGENDVSLIAIEHIVGDNEPFISGTLLNGSRLVCCKQTHQGSRHPTRLSHAKAGYHMTTPLSFVIVGI